MIKKGAMFALDARIALAIFGALSVISGAALYSAIQQSKVVSYISQIEELNKAFDSYRLDTGQDLPLFSTSSSQLDLSELISSSVTGWKGPYIPFNNIVSGGASNYFLVGDQRYYFNIWKDTDWGYDSTTPVSPEDCVINEPCILYISLQNISTSLVESIDEYVDGSISHKTGNIRRWSTDALYYKINIRM